MNTNENESTIFDIDYRCAFAVALFSAIIYTVGGLYGPDSGTFAVLASLLLLFFNTAMFFNLSANSVEFAEKGQKKAVIAAVFSLIILLVTYVPALYFMLRTSCEVVTEHEYCLPPYDITEYGEQFVVYHVPMVRFCVFIALIGLVGIVLSLLTMIGVIKELMSKKNCSVCLP